MGDAASHLADDFHLLRLAELFFELEFFGDVVDQDEFRGPAIHGQVEGGDLDVDHGPVLGAVPPVGGRLVAGLAAGGHGAKARAVLGRADVVDGHAQELGPRIAVLVDGGVVDGKEAEGFAIEDPHRVRVRVEEQPVPFLASAQGI